MESFIKDVDNRLNNCAKKFSIAKSEEEREEILEKIHTLIQLRNIYCDIQEKALKQQVEYSL